MSDITSPLAEFDNPPLIELALSVQFEQLEAFGAPQLGLLWAHFRDQYPITEEQPPLPPVIERFGPKDVGLPKMHFELRTSPELPRYWFKNEQSSALIQVQRDRLIFNWRKARADDEYPRYDHVFSKFMSTYRMLERFVSDERLGVVRPNQCEVTYVNHLKQGQGWTHLGQIGEVVTFWSPLGQPFPLEPEAVRVAASYVISGDDQQPIGRLHITLEPALAVDEQKPILVMQLTARGRPLGEGPVGISQFMDIGHKWINRAFVAVTSPKMHRIWGIRDGN